MKKRMLLYPVALIAIAVVFQSSILFEGARSVEEVDIPENVKSVLDNKCFGCHNTEAKSDKAKDKLLLDKLDDLSKAKMISTLGNISEVAAEGSMPPEKFLEQKPEKKLTEEEQKLLVEWADNTSEELLN